MKLHVGNSEFEYGRLVQFARRMGRRAARNHGTQLVDVRVQLVSPSLLTGIPARPEDGHLVKAIFDNSPIYSKLTFVT